jgi:Ca2+-transporting ATPase
MNENKDLPLYYRQSDSQVFSELDTSPQGLSAAAAKKRLEENGPNTLQQQKQESWLKIFLKQFQDLLVIVLIAAGIISAFTGELVSAIVIFVVITLNAILGTVQTLQARKSLNALKQLSAVHVKVIRDGKMELIPSADLVVGDIVSVEAGDVIEGDGRLFETASLQINESALTGEVLPQTKTTAPIEENVQINDQTNMVFSSSQVTNGTGRYIVTASGMNTEIGKIASLIENAAERKTPLQHSLEEFSKKLTLYISILCLILFVMQIVFAKQSVADALLVAVALAVAAIPEAMTSIVTIVLSIATRKMADEHAIMKQLDAAEALGSVSVICSDKTGTLTQNKMSVTDVFTLQNTGKPADIDPDANYAHKMLLKAFALANNASLDGDKEIGDPTEVALLAAKNDYQKKHPEYLIEAQRLDELPFDSERKLMSVSSCHHLYTKGAVDSLLDRCSLILDGDKKRPFTDADKAYIEEWNAACANKGLRVLAFAYKPFTPRPLSLADEDDLTFIGMVAMQDPPRVESADAVAKAKLAGIKPIMITGDHKITAKAIAKQIGIYQDGDMVLTGSELADLTEEQLAEILPKVSVYARVAPEHKIRIVKAWQNRNDVVAMTGDGVNDAPALKQSDIGVAMGITGTEVSKEAAKMILTDDNFQTIVKAVIAGRNIYRNIQNAIVYLLSGNLSAVMLVTLCTFLVLPNPFAAIHLLFINLVTDSLPAIAIGAESSDDSLLLEKPRSRSASILSAGVLKEIAIEGFLIFLGVFAAYETGLQTSTAAARTMAFGTLCLARLLHGFSSRSSRPLWMLKVNKYSVYAFLLGFALLCVILLVPGLHETFQVITCTPMQLLAIVLCALGTFVLVQLYKLLTYKKAGNR